MRLLRIELGPAISRSHHEDVRVLDGLDTSVADPDTVVILPAMAGGTPSKRRFAAGDDGFRLPRLREGERRGCAQASPQRPEGEPASPARFPPPGRLPARRDRDRAAHYARCPVIVVR